jgi:hypothetical protein
MKKVDRTDIQLRTHNVIFRLNDNEYEAMRRYLDKYKITNKSRWCRETMLSHIILKTLEEDYPTLFKESEMRR